MDKLLHLAFRLCGFSIVCFSGRLVCRRLEIVDGYVRFGLLDFDSCCFHSYVVPFLTHTFDFAGVSDVFCFLERFRRTKSKSQPRMKTHLDACALKSMKDP